ncbi:hypothetical protein NL676_008798 [Syzygium grande]|nr:hypothetical protein NL676_008798 [Syzygium grande]
MPRKTSGASRRAWSLLRAALLWARKGGAFKLQLRLVPKFLRTIGRVTPRGQICDDQLCYGYDSVRKSFLENGGEGETRFEEEEEGGRMGIEEEQGIDTRAEEFIAKFYEQMKLQRQISYLQYREMLNRSAS